jgi:hypothetical protein
VIILIVFNDDCSLNPSKNPGLRPIMIIDTTKINNGQNSYGLIIFIELTLDPDILPNKTLLPSHRE